MIAHITRGTMGTYRWVYIPSEAEALKDDLIIYGLMLGLWFFAWFGSGLIVKRLNKNA